MLKTLHPALVFWTIGIFALNANAQPTSPQDTDGATAKIQAAIAAYVVAFNNRDVEKLVALWSPDGVYTQRDTGEQVNGRESIAIELKKIMAEAENTQLSVTTQSIDVISPNVALERGSSVVTKGEDSFESEYTVVFVKRDDEWLIDRVTENEISSTISNRERLQPLEWMVGEWTDVVEDSTIEFSCQWTSNQNYLSRTYKVSDAGGVTSSGLQIIGWDPIKKQIRSWLFDSDGSYVSGLWTESEGRWVVQSLATLVDGSEGSFTSIFRPLEDGNYGWQKTNRVLNGELLPSIDEVIIQRK